MSKLLSQTIKILGKSKHPKFKKPENGIYEADLSFFDNTFGYVDRPEPFKPRLIFKNGLWWCYGLYSKCSGVTVKDALDAWLSKTEWKWTS